MPKPTVRFVAVPATFKNWLGCDAVPCHEPAKWVRVRADRRCDYVCEAHSNEGFRVTFPLPAFAYEAHSSEATP